MSARPRPAGRTAGAPTAVLGAGLAGLSLARALVRERPGAPVVLVDRRREWTRDRTWCFWAVDGVADAALATARWTAWKTVDARGRVAVQRAPELPYVHVPADAFYDAALAELDREPSVELLTETRVLGVRRGAEGFAVETSAGELACGSVVDAMGGAGPLLRERPAGTVELRQRFLGLEVEVARPVFDPDVPSLMDFRLPPVDGAVRFAYVLPFSRTRALVEDTTLAPGPVLPDAERRAAILDHLDATWRAGEVIVVREERGVLPMSTHRFACARGPGLYAVGVAGGAARPSSGYAFVRTQRQAAGLARTLAHGAPPPALDPPRRRVLDELFLRALAASPGSGPGWFCALARRVRGPAFARFMSDASGAVDDAQVVAALAEPRFLGAMARTRPAPGLVRAALRSRPSPSAAA